MTALDGPRIVRELRGDLTQAEFAARIGRSTRAVCYWERGERVPSLDAFGAMLEAAGEETAVDVVAGLIPTTSQKGEPQ
jgi:DNA-binding transcriptional regulator YiaG